MAHVPIAELITQAQLDEYRELVFEDATAVLQLTQEATRDSYDAIAVPLTNETWRKRWREMCLTDEHRTNLPPEVQRRAEYWRELCGPFIKSELNITRLDEAHKTIGVVSEWLELDSPDDGVRYDAEIALRQELAYASYLNLLTVILPPPRNRDRVADYARAVNACLSITYPGLQISLRIPVYDPRSSSVTSHQEDTPVSPLLRAPEGDLSSTWEMWDVIRTICGHSPRLSLTLDLSLPLPSLKVLGRWHAEPVDHLLLPSTAFIANGKGYPVLPKAMQSFLRDFIKHSPTILLSGTKNGLHPKGGHLAYGDYIRHLEKTSPVVLAAEKPGTVESFAQGYWDYLQAPLQPLMDNLQGVTYEVFERDPVKYERYEEAVFQALSHRPQNSRTVIALAGAGRGGLVSRCLVAFERSDRKGIVYAIEKNPSAFVTLQARKEAEWGDKVQILHGDMRVIEIPEKADILVSELLGSFGDNELSPECLDGAMRFLRPEGISIPSSYTAHLAPISSSRLHKEFNPKDDKGAETPYVVMFQAINMLSGDGGGLRGACGPKVQECWSFFHPRPGAVLNAQGIPITNAHNVRSAKLTFHIPHAGVLHGLAGYFEAVLYGDIGLSIHPETKDHISPHMLSWFPLFFPFKDPLYLPSNSELQVSVWRVADKTKVWYEWYAESFLPVVNLPPPASPSPTPKAGSHMSMDHSPGGNSPSAKDSKFLSPAMASIPSPHMSANSIQSEQQQSEKDYGFTLGADGGISLRAQNKSTVIKIGQTALHNPGGRSSWIGL